MKNHTEETTTSRVAINFVKTKLPLRYVQIRLTTCYSANEHEVAGKVDFVIEIRIYVAKWKTFFFLIKGGNIRDGNFMTAKVLHLAYWLILKCIPNISANHAVGVRFIVNI